MNDTTIMAEEMKAPTKVAFANRKYSNEDKRKIEEEELEQLIAEQKGEVTETTEEVVEASATEEAVEETAKEEE